MKKFRFLPIIGILILLSVLINEDSSASDINSEVGDNEEIQLFKVEVTSTSIIASTTIKKPLERLLPYSIWHTKGAYGGYLPLVNTRFSQGSFIGTYRGYLYKNVAPHSNNNLE